MVDFDVVDLPDVDHPEVGDTVPDFTRPLVDEEFWENVALSDLYADGPVLLVFHPMDGAFPATYIWNEIRDREWQERLEVVGVSVSSPYEHKTLIEERGIDSRLYSDPGAGVAEQFGIDWELDGMEGVREPWPAVFLVDTEGTIRYAWVASEWPDFPEYDEVETAIADHV
ncbi:redoxin domain-containing protein [Halomarina oriensis]|uniref:Redoxin domain-containing protein n=1 Tax=Halomarina oriensis TaxID=671145 RepID=A0A6B0GL55_9EURY|nr:redoxin domain-containing protein [Halomarina oriensis]MWG34457.1 redoxin domain-containing protein [Halomarina oriensis]